MSRMALLNLRGSTMTDSEGEFSYASFGRRSGAWLLDYLIYFLPGHFMVNLIWLMGLPRTEASWGQANAVLLALYLAIFQFSRPMATPAMRILGLQIHDENRSRLTFWRCFLRNLAGIFLATIFFVSWWQVWLSKRPRPLHDELFDAHVSFHPKSQRVLNNTETVRHRQKLRYERSASQRPHYMSLDEAIAWEKEHGSRSEQG